MATDRTQVDAPVLTETLKRLPARAIVARNPRATAATSGSTGQSHLPSPIGCPSSPPPTPPGRALASLPTAGPRPRRSPRNKQARPSSTWPRPDRRIIPDRRGGPGLERRPAAPAPAGPLRHRRQHRRFTLLPAAEPRSSGARSAGGLPIAQGYATRAGITFAAAWLPGVLPMTGTFTARPQHRQPVLNHLLDNPSTRRCHA
jgi:hypothetical protein